MKFNKLKAAVLPLLLVIWVVAPALGIWVWLSKGFFDAVLFALAWLIAD